jgi:uncharacterized protein YndB with AHSA1/START domain
VTSSRVLVAVRVAAPPERTFAAFTREIGAWWRPNPLFRFTDRPDGRLAFEPDPPERLVEVGPDGVAFEIGRVHEWDPPSRLAFGWRQAGFADDQSTDVVVTFVAVDDGDTTRVTVEHFGWDRVPQEHAARHGFPLRDFQQRTAEWWQVLLGSLGTHVAAPRASRGPDPAV